LAKIGSDRIYNNQYTIDFPFCKHLFCKQFAPNKKASRWTACYVSGSEPFLIQIKRGKCFIPKEKEIKIVFLHNKNSSRLRNLGIDFL